MTSPVSGLSLCYISRDPRSIITRHIEESIWFSIAFIGHVRRSHGGMWYLLSSLLSSRQT